MFETSFSVNGEIIQTPYNLMGCSIVGPGVNLYTLQGIVGWDLAKNIEAYKIVTEEIYCGDSGPLGEVCTAHEKSVMVWDVRLRKPTNCILAHSM